MTDDFCKVSITKRFMKCKSLHTNECYVMIGGNKSQKKTADKIHKKFKSGSNPLQSIKDNKLREFYNLLSSDDISSMDRDDIETILTKELCLDKYKDAKGNLHFVYGTSLNDEDTVKIILTKMCMYCSEENLLPPYLYAWYFDSNGKHQTIGFNYEKGISLSMTNNVYESDSNFVDSQGVAINVEKTSHMLDLFERYRDITDNTIYFITLKEFLLSSKKLDVITTLTPQDSKKDKEISEFVNGFLKKYWPTLTISQMNTLESPTYENVVERVDKYVESVEYIESEMNKHTMSCDAFRIKLLRIQKQSNKENMVQLSKLFTEKPNSKCIESEIGLLNPRLK